jgi:hypothetical protein
VLIGFWENHDPTQGDRQGNDVGSNYRSAIYYADEAQHRIALQTRDVYQQAMSKAGHGPITTEIAAAPLQPRRGLPPGLSGEESARLLRPRRHRRALSGRRGGQSAPMPAH